jgi:hypothetical protein
VGEDACMVTQAITLTRIMRMGMTPMTMTVMDRRNQREVQDEQYNEKI